MKTVDRYILREVKLPIIFAVSVFTFIFLIDIIVSMMENIILRGISLIDTIRILSFYIPPILSQTIPIGVFIGIMVTFSKFTKNSESVAFFSMGMSLKRIISPVLKLTTVLVLFLFFLQEAIIPSSFEKLKYITTKIAIENPIFSLKEKMFIRDIPGIALYVDKINSKTSVASGVILLQHDEETMFPMVIVGRETKMDKESIVLKNASFFKFKESGETELTGKFKEKKISLSSYARDMNIKLKDREGMGVWQLIPAYLKAEDDDEEKLFYLVEANKKIAVPLAMFFLSILGVLLSVGHHRSGKGTNYFISLTIMFIYIVILNVGVTLSNRGILPIFIGVWLPNILLALFTIFVYKRKAKVM